MNKKKSCLFFLIVTVFTWMAVSCSQPVTLSVSVSAKTDSDGSKVVLIEQAGTSYPVYYTLDGSDPLTTESGSTFLYSSSTTSDVARRTFPTGSDKDMVVVRYKMTDGGSSNTLLSGSENIAISSTKSPYVTSITKTEGGLLLTVMSDSANPAIYYTLDGSFPTVNNHAGSVANGGTIEVKGQKKLQMVAVSGSLVASPVVTKNIVQMDVGLAINDIEGGRSVTITSSNVDQGKLVYTIDGVRTETSEISTSIPYVSVMAADVAFTAQGVASDTQSVSAASFYCDSPLVSKTMKKVEKLGNVLFSPVYSTDGEGLHICTVGMTTAVSVPNSVIHYDRSNTVNDTDPPVLTKNDLKSEGSSAVVKDFGKTAIYAYASCLGYVDSDLTKSDLISLTNVQKATFAAKSTDDGFTRSVTIRNNNRAASGIVYYTVDGSLPVDGMATSFTDETLTLGPIGKDTTIKALAVINGYSSIITEIKLAQLAAPTVVGSQDISGGKSFVVNSASAGLDIHYSLDGNDPGTSSESFTTASKTVELKTAGTYVPKTVAMVASSTLEDGTGLNSPIVKGSTIVVDRVAIPKYSYVRNNDNLHYLISMKAGDTLPEETIQYSTDGGSNWNTYSAPFDRSEGTITLKAKGVKAGYQDSDVDDSAASFPFTVEEPNEGNKNLLVLTKTLSGENWIVKLANNYTQSVVVYTLDGSVPSLSNGKWIEKGTSVSDIKVTPKDTLKAKAFNGSYAYEFAIDLVNLPDYAVGTKDVLGGKAFTFTLNTVADTSGMVMNYTISRTFEGKTDSYKSGTATYDGDAGYWISEDMLLPGQFSVEAVLSEDGYNDKKQKGNVTIERVATPVETVTDISTGKKLEVSCPTKSVSGTAIDTVYLKYLESADAITETPTRNTSTSKQNEKYVYEKTDAAGNRYLRARAYANGYAESEELSSLMKVYKLSTPKASVTPVETGKQMAIACPTIAEDALGASIEVGLKPVLRYTYNASTAAPGDPNEASTALEATKGYEYAISEIDGDQKTAGSRSVKVKAYLKGYVPSDITLKSMTVNKVRDPATKKLLVATGACMESYCPTTAIDASSKQVETGLVTYMRYTAVEGDSLPADPSDPTIKTSRMEAGEDYKYTIAEEDGDRTTAGSRIVKVKAYRTGYLPSNVVKNSMTVEKIATPIASSSNEIEGKSIAITCPTATVGGTSISGSLVRYNVTTNGTEPNTPISTSGTAGSVDSGVSYHQKYATNHFQMKGKAFCNGYIPSDPSVKDVEIKKMAVPTYSTTDKDYGKTLHAYQSAKTTEGQAVSNSYLRYTQAREYDYWIEDVTASSSKTISYSLDRIVTSIPTKAMSLGYTANFKTYCDGYEPSETVKAMGKVEQVAEVTAKMKMDSVPDGKCTECYTRTRGYTSDTTVNIAYSDSPTTFGVTVQSAPNSGYGDGPSYTGWEKGTTYWYAWKKGYLPSIANSIYVPEWMYGHWDYMVSSNGWVYAIYYYADKVSIEKAKSWANNRRQMEYSYTTSVYQYSEPGIPRMKYSSVDYYYSESTPHVDRNAVFAAVKQHDSIPYGKYFFTGACYDLDSGKAWAVYANKDGTWHFDDKSSEWPVIMAPRGNYADWLTQKELISAGNALSY